MLSGIKVTDAESAHRAAQAIGEKGIENVIITLGKDGAYVKEKDTYTLIPSKQVETIDTTGAGDVFCGAFSVYLAEQHSISESVQFANAAAADHLGQQAYHQEGQGEQDQGGVHLSHIGAQADGGKKQGTKDDIGVEPVHKMVLVFNHPEVDLTYDDNELVNLNIEKFTDKTEDWQ